jgi:hypothetical protein
LVGAALALLEPWGLKALAVVAVAVQVGLQYEFILPHHSRALNLILSARQEVHLHLVLLQLQ